MTPSRVLVADGGQGTAPAPTRARTRSAFNRAGLGLVGGHETPLLSRRPLLRYDEDARGTPADAGAAAGDRSAAAGLQDAEELALLLHFRREDPAPFVAEALLFLVFKESLVGSPSSQTANPSSPDPPALTR